MLQKKSILKWHHRQEMPSRQQQIEPYNKHAVNEEPGMSPKWEERSWNNTKKEYRKRG